LESAGVTQEQDVPAGIPRLTFEEQTAVTAYEKAVSDALSAADSAAEKLITAAFSIATAYGALVALVAPKEETRSLVLGLPFIFLRGQRSPQWSRTRLAST
jgi:hypothetical protein